MRIQTTSSRVVYFIILGQVHHFHVCAFPTLRQTIFLKSHHWHCLYKQPRLDLYVLSLKTEINAIIYVPNSNFKLDHFAEKKALGLPIQTATSRIVCFVISGRNQHFHKCTQFPTLSQTIQLKNKHQDCLYKRPLLKLFCLIIFFRPSSTITCM